MANPCCSLVMLLQPELRNRGKSQSHLPWRAVPRLRVPSGAVVARRSEAISRLIARREIAALACVAAGEGRRRQ